MWIRRRKKNGNCKKLLQIRPPTLATHDKFTIFTNITIYYNDIHFCNWRHQFQRKRKKKVKINHFCLFFCCNSLCFETFENVLIQMGLNQNIAIIPTYARQINKPNQKKNTAFTNIFIYFNLFRPNRNETETKWNIKLQNHVRILFSCGMQNANVNQPYKLVLILFICSIEKAVLKGKRFMKWPIIL